MKIRNYLLIRSLIGQLAVAVLVPLLLILAGTLYGDARTLRAAIGKTVQSSVSKTSQLLNLTVSSSLANNDLSTLDVFFGEMLSDNDNQGLVYVVLGREDGAPLINTLGRGRAVPPPDAPGAYETAALHGIIHVRDPLLLPGKRVGYLQYGLATGDVISAIGREQRRGFWISGVIAATAVVLALWLAVRISRQIRELIRASQEVAFGNYDRKVQVSGADELATLAAYFNRMSEAVQSKISEVTALNQTLEARVHERTLELEQANALLQENLSKLSEAKDHLVRSEKLAGLGALVAGVAHELNTPIGNAVTLASTIEGATAELIEKHRSGALRKSEFEILAEQTRMASAVLSKNLTRASELIVSFKTVAIDRSSEQRRPFNLRQTVSELVLSLGPSLHRSPYTLDVDIPDDITIDSYPGPLNQVMTNLITNGITHAFEGRDAGTMRIAAWIAPEDNAWVVIEYQDDGIGIPEPNLKRIFDPFFTTKLGRGGSGLGLNITHNIVDGLLGGKISARSQVGQGTAITLRIPLVAPRHANPAPDLSSDW